MSVAQCVLSNTASRSLDFGENSWPSTTHNSHFTITGTSTMATFSCPEFKSFHSNHSNPLIDDLHKIATSLQWDYDDFKGGRYDFSAVHVSLGANGKFPQKLNEV